MAQLYEFASQFTVSAVSEDHPHWRHYRVKVEYRGGGRWAVTSQGEVLNRYGEWDYEPSPSTQDAGWLHDHRFDLDQALALARHTAVELLSMGGQS